MAHPHRWSCPRCAMRAAAATQVLCCSAEQAMARLHVPGWPWLQLWCLPLVHKHNFMLSHTLRPRPWLRAQASSCMSSQRSKPTESALFSAWLALPVKQQGKQATLRACAARLAGPWRRSWRRRALACGQRPARLTCYAALHQRPRSLQVLRQSGSERHTLRAASPARHSLECVVARCG